MTETDDMSVENREEIETVEGEVYNPPEAKKSLVSYSAFQNITAFEDSARMAKALMVSNLIPDQFKSNLGDCLIVLELSQRMKCSPFALMNKLYQVHGRWAIMSEFMIAAINQSGKCSPIRYDETGEGDDKTCVAWVKDRQGEILKSVPVSIKLAKQNGWWDKKDSHWPKNPDLMLRYRAATFLARQYFPELTLGMSTAEEVYDIDEPSDEPAPRRSNVDDAIFGNKKPIEGSASDEPIKDDKPFTAEEIIKLLKGTDSVDEIDELEDRGKEFPAKERNAIKAAAGDARRRVADAA